MIWAWRVSTSAGPARGFFLLNRVFPATIACLGGGGQTVGLCQSPETIHYTKLIKLNTQFKGTHKHVYMFSTVITPIFKLL